MKQKSLDDALADCTNSCGWCVNHCPDEEKYEMLIVCISIQKEFVKLGSLVNNILADRTFELMKKIISLFETLAEVQPSTNLVIIQNNVKTDFNSEDNWKLPGCSQIFGVASSLEWIYVNQDLKYNTE